MSTKQQEKPKARGRPKGSKNLESKKNTQTFLDVLNHLYEQKKTLDKQSANLDKLSIRNDTKIVEMQQKFVVAVSKSISKKITQTNRKTYVPRKDNDRTLIEAIHSSMIPNKKMNMKEILFTMKNSGFYDTDSGYFYTMVNNKLHQDSNIAKLSNCPEVPRGIFIYKYRPRDSNGKFSSQLAIA